MNLRGAFVLVVICVLGATAAGAQLTNGAPAPPQSTSVALNPEDSFLSSSRYTNAYFGFEVDFPAEAHLKPIPTTSTLDRRIQMLELVGSGPQHAWVSICAYEYKNKNYTDAKGILRRQLDQELFAGVEELHGLAKTNIDGHQFYYFAVRKGAIQHMELATELSGYIVLAALQANDPAMVNSLTTAFYHLIFFAPQEARSHVGADAVPYQGPSLSAQHLSEIKAADPAAHMDAGKVHGNIYRNDQIGMSYEFPQGWSVEPEGGVEPSVERYRATVIGEPDIGPRERAAVKACRRTLLSAWKTKPAADGQVPYDDFGEVTLSAMPLSCFPNIQFPDNPNDAGAVRRFIVGLVYTQPLQRDMTDARTYEAGGKPFILTHGTIAYKEAGEALSRRVSVATAITEHRGYLLTWLFAAPHDAELRELMSAKVGFDPDKDSTGSITTKVAGGSGPSESSAPSTTIAPSPNPVSSEPSSGKSSDATSDTTAQPEAPPSSLLGDGILGQTQAPQGAAIPHKNPD